MWLLGKARYRISDLTGYRISDLTESRISVFLFALNIFKKHRRTFSFFQVDKCHIRLGIPVQSEVTLLSGRIADIKKPDYRAGYPVHALLQGVISKRAGYPWRFSRSFLFLSASA